MAAAFKPTFGRLDGTVDASGATDHDALLETFELMPVGAEEVFEKTHSISAHDCKSPFAVTIGLPQTDVFDLAQYRCPSPLPAALDRHAERRDTPVRITAPPARL
jgi:hypothetical protein